jgi:hypothetical protein
MAQAASIPAPGARVIRVRDDPSAESQEHDVLLRCRFETPCGWLAGARVAKTFSDILVFLVRVF